MQVSLNRLTRRMKKYRVFSQLGRTYAARLKVNKSGSALKHGLDVRG